VSESWRERLAPFAASLRFPGAAIETATMHVTQGRFDSVLLTPVGRINAWSDAGFAAVVTQAANRYFVERWLPADPRFRLAVIVAPQDPILAVQEIERHAGQDRVVAISMPMIGVLMGDPHHYPIYEAAERAGLTVAVYPTGSEGLFTGSAGFAAGAGMTDLERRVLLPQLAQANLNSLVFQGVLKRFPSLRFLFTGFGFGWLTSVLWRMDMDWRRLRIETPWVTEPPSAHIKGHVWVGVSNPAELNEGFAEAPPFVEEMRTLAVYASAFGSSDASEPAIGKDLDPEVSGSQAETAISFVRSALSSPRVGGR
jgi:predicted TIM-barrel fold metal-dependent hydrolase